MQAERVGRGVAHAYSWRGKRIGGTASGQVHGVDARPAERRIDEDTGHIAGQELFIGGELADTDIHHILEQALFEIQVRKSGAAHRLDVADRQQVADVVGAQVPAVDLIGADLEPATGPADQLFEVDREIDLGFAIEHRTLLHSATDIAQDLGGVREVERDAASFQRRPQTAPIAGQPIALPETGRPSILRHGGGLRIGRGRGRCQHGAEDRCRRERGGPLGQPTGNCKLCHRSRSS